MESNFGKDMAKKTKGKTYEQLYGSKKAKEIKLKIANKLTERQKGKTWEELWGEETAKKVKEKLKYIRKDIKPMLGKKHSEKTKKLFSEQRKGNKNTLGRKLSDNHKEKLSEAFSMERNPAWKGGVSFEPYPPQFNDKLKDLIRERDSFVCQLCVKKQSECGEKLSVHHMDLNKDNISLSNLISLCRNCHSKVHAHFDKYKEHLNKLVVVLNVS